jgi:hypothetical protein
MFNVQWDADERKPLSIEHSTLDIAPERLVTKPLTELTNRRKDWPHEDTRYFRSDGAFDCGDR